MTIRQATPEDLEAITQLFYDTVKEINSRDYPAQQIDIWAYAAFNRKKWLEKIESEYFLVAMDDEVFAGFGSIEKDGYLDLMYVHKDFQRQGIAQSILDQLEAWVQKRKVKQIVTEASITAVPFCLKNGYQKVRKQYHEVDGIRITNYKMVKSLK